MEVRPSAQAGGAADRTDSALCCQVSNGTTFTTFAWAELATAPTDGHIRGPRASFKCGRVLNLGGFRPVPSTTPNAFLLDSCWDLSAYRSEESLECAASGDAELSRVGHASYSRVYDDRAVGCFGIEAYIQIRHVRLGHAALPGSRSGPRASSHPNCRTTAKKPAPERAALDAGYNRNGDRTVSRLC